MANVNFILDEAANVGRMDCIDDAINSYRDYGVRLQLYYESPAQLKRCFRSGGDQTVLANSTHMFIFGPNSASSLIVPWLLASNEAAVVIDFKGENAMLTARHREGMFGHRCVFLDPHRVVTMNPDTLNPLDFIDSDSPNNLDDCFDLAEHIVAKTGDAREPRWDQSAKDWISAAIAATVHHGDAERSLDAIRYALADPDRPRMLSKFLCTAEGMLPRLGGQLSFFKDEEFASTLMTANRHMRFLDTPAVSESTSSSSFDPRDLRKGKMTVYCILPPHHMRAQSALMRIWIGTLLRSVVKGGLQNG